MKPIAEMMPTEVAALVKSYARPKSIAVVLSGRAAVAIYTGSECFSRDPDRVNARSVNHQTPKVALTECGFLEEDRYFFSVDSQHLRGSPGE